MRTEFVREALIRVGLVSLLLGNAGCGVILQAAFGFTYEEERPGVREAQVLVESNPVGASISRIDENGNEEALGPAPLTDTVSYDATQTWEVPNTKLPMVIGLILDAGITAGGIAFLASRDDTDVDLIDTAELLVITGLIYFIPAFIADAIALGVTVGGDEKVKRHKPIGDGRAVRYKADFGGETKELAARVPKTGRIELTLAGQSRVVDSGAGGDSGGSGGSRKGKVIAVMNVESRSKIDKGLLINVADQLRVFLAQVGFRTIDRGAQEAALKEQVEEMKKDSYKECYDSSCQVELGKALAAEFILRSNVAQFGSRCVLNAELVELRTEVTIDAASATGPCEPEGFLTMTEKVAKEIIKP